MSEGLISIVVPIYGVEDFLPQCIDSLLTQVHRRIEVILVNDGSRDRSGAICDQYASLDGRIRVIHKENGGLVSARKAGASVATGDYLGFVDGDDWVGGDFFGMLYDQAASASADLVISGHIREFLGKQEVIPPRSPLGVYDRRRVLEELLPTAIYNGTFFQHGVSTYVWNKLFRRREAARFIHEIDPQIVMGEDAALTYPYLASCNCVVVSKPGSYFYRQRSNSIVKSVPNINQEYERLSALFCYLKSRVEGLPFETDLLRQLRFYFYSQVLVRSGAVLGTNSEPDCSIPFPNLRAGQRVVVYSSGSFGQHVVSAIRRLSRFELVGWLDEDDHESQRSGLPVTSPNSVLSIDFDLLLIAAIDSEYSRELAAQLVGRGVPTAKISILTPDFARLDHCLRKIGFDIYNYRYSAPA